MSTSYLIRSDHSELAKENKFGLELQNSRKKSLVSIFVEHHFWCDAVFFALRCNWIDRIKFRFEVNKSVKVSIEPAKRVNSSFSILDLKCRRKRRDKTVANARLDGILTSTTTHILCHQFDIVVARGHRSKHRARITLRVKCYVKEMEMNAALTAAAQFTRTQTKNHGKLQ